MHSRMRAAFFLHSRPRREDKNKDFSAFRNKTLHG